MRFVSLLCLLFLLTLSSYAQHTAGAPSTQQPPPKEIDALKKELASLTQRLSTLEGTATYLQFEVNQKQDLHDSILLDMSDHTYQRLDTDSGFFLITVEDAVPYLDGYKVHLKIGNPLYMAYIGFKLKMKWAKKFDSAKSDFAVWNKSAQEREVSFTNVLAPNSWNQVEVIVTPAAPDELGFFQLSITTSEVRLQAN